MGQDVSIYKKIIRMNLIDEPSPVITDRIYLKTFATPNTIWKV